VKGHGTPWPFSLLRRLMTDSELEQGDDGADKARRAEQRAAARAEKLRAEEETREKTRRQSETAEEAVVKLEAEVEVAATTSARRYELAHHLKGFYSEIDKLTKGKGMIQVTDVLVESFNDIVRDAKSIVDGDTYLNRVKEFVPAGDNPTYAEMLVKTRAVVESLERFKQRIEAREKAIAKALREANTIRAAAQYYIENGEVPAKEDIQAWLGGRFISGDWFLGNENGDEVFDFERLDTCNLEEYFTVNGRREAE
jgi:DNA repair exonuclease SbcCD ATPase subunit